MSRIIRKIEAVKSWGGAYASSATEPPLSALPDFIPSERDGGQLSTFEIDDDDDALLIAGAFALQNLKLSSGQMVFAAVEADILKDHGFDIGVSRGLLNHKAVDGKHRHLTITSIEQSVSLARLFLAGELLSFEGGEIGQSASASARNNEFIFSAIFKSGVEANPCTRHLATFVRTGVVEARGL